MTLRTRRDVLADVGKGMVLATLGAGFAADLGVGPAWADDDPGRLTFGDLEPLVAFFHETPPDTLLPQVVEKLGGGTDLKTVVAAAALANARAFGGEDYVGFHTLMALSPAYQMAAEETTVARRPLPVLKVLFRNATRLQEKGGKAAEVLRPVRPAADRSPVGDQLREAVRRGDLPAAEGTFAAVSAKPTDALDELMVMVDDATEVHRVVLVSRSWDLIDFVGTDRAHALLRQSVHYCVKNEPYSKKHHQKVRDELPKALDRHKLLAATEGAKTGDDAWVGKLAEAIFRATPEGAMEAAAAALAEGFAPDAVGEAVTLAANQLVLRDEGRPANQTAPNKPAGSVHGDSIGVHACDSANAWRTLAKVGGRRTRVTSLLLGAFQVARDRAERGGDFLTWEPYPRGEHVDKVRGLPAESLLKELDGAVREKDQARAAAIVGRIGAESAGSARGVFDLLRGYAVSEDGALHAEKFYRTAAEEFARSRPAYRWRQLAALARVTASAYGQPAPGYAEARDLLKG
jgi:hypothetical protein